MADYSLSTNMVGSRTSLLDSAKLSPRTVRRKWKQLSTLQRNLVGLAVLLVLTASVYVFWLRDPSDDAALAPRLRVGLKEQMAPQQPNPGLSVAERKPPLKQRMVADREFVAGAHEGANIEHQRSAAEDSLGNKVERVNKVVHLHHVNRLGDEDGDDDPGGVQEQPRDPERDDLEQQPAAVPEKPGHLIPGPVRRQPIVFPGPTNERQKAVVGAFQHAWQAYRAHAWGHDHLKPISKQAHDWFGLGLTLIDSLDTMYIMNLMEEFHEARDWVATRMNLNVQEYVNVFETTIRVLGGLLSAHYLSQDEVFLKKAIDLGDRLMPAFNTASGIPFSDVNLQTRRARGPAWNPDSSTAEVATLQLEFNQLSYASGDLQYSDKATAVSRHISGLQKREGLVPIYISTQDGSFRQYSVITMGARGDSYYEYLIKQYAQLGAPLAYLRDDFNASVQGIQHLLVKKSKPNDLTFLAELMSGGKNAKPKMDHLACFLPGALALSVRLGLPTSYMKVAEELLHTCYLTYARQPTGLAPEITYFNMNPGAKEDFFVKTLDAHNLLRPETVESLWVLYHLTGNKTYQDWGWNIFQAFEKYSKVATGGYTSLGSVLQPENTQPRDNMESFFLGETLKYFYLLFSDDQKTLNLNDHVFNTEAHPLPVLRRPPSPSEVRKAAARAQAGAAPDYI